MSGSGIYSTVFEDKNTAAATAAAAARAPAPVNNTGEKGKQDVQRTVALVSASTAALFKSGVGYIKLVQWAFFLSFGALILFLLLVGLHYLGLPVFAFTPNDPGVISIPTAENKQIANIKTYSEYDTTYNFQRLTPYNVTFGLDVMVDSDFTTTVPRVIWYMADGFVQLDNTAKEVDLPILFPDSSVVLYLDPLRNDLKVLLQGATGKTATDTCVENVPIGTAFRINFVVTTMSVEIYFRGRLVKTVTLEEKLLQAPANANVFGPPQIVNSIRVANASYWSYTISPTMIQVNGTEKVNPSIFA